MSDCSSDVCASDLSKYIDLLPAYNGIAYLEGHAQLDKDAVRLNGERLEAGKIIIATGSSASVPSIPGLGGVPYLTSTTAFELESLPASLLMIGGGYIGCELAQMFARAGVRSEERRVGKECVSTWRSGWWPEH